MQTKVASAYDPFKHLVDFNSFTKDVQNSDSSPEGSYSRRYEETTNPAKRKYDSKLRVKRDPEALREDSKNRQKNLRKQMKDLFQQLALSIRPPLSPQESTKTILQKSVEYIQQLNLFVDCMQMHNHNGSSMNQNLTLAENATASQVPTTLPASQTAPFAASPSFRIPEMSETDKELENILFVTPKTGHSRTLSSLSSFSDNHSAHFDTASNASSDNLDDDLLFMDSLSDIPTQRVDPFVDTSVLSIPKKIQKTQDRHSNQKRHVTSATLVDLNTLSPPQSPTFAPFSQPLITSPSPRESNFFDSYVLSPSFQPIPSYSHFAGSSSSPKPTSPTMFFSSSPSSLFVPLSPLKQESLLIKQENSIPDLVREVTSPTKPSRPLDERPLLNAFGKLELF